MRVNFWISLFCATVLLSAPAASEVLQRLQIDAGSLTVVQDENGDKTLLLGDTPLLEDYPQIDLFEAGQMGVLVQTHHGGRFCPLRYHVIDAHSGTLRQPRLGSDDPTLLVECLPLATIVADLGLLVFEPGTHTEQAILISWDGYAFQTTSITKQARPPAGSESDVTRWDGRSVAEFLSDPSEQARLFAFQPQDDVQWILTEMTRGDVMRLENGFLIGTACSPFECGFTWANLAIRIKDSAVFVQLSNQDPASVSPEIRKLFE